MKWLKLFMLAVLIILMACAAASYVLVQKTAKRLAEMELKRKMIRLEALKRFKSIVRMSKDGPFDCQLGLILPNTTLNDIIAVYKGSEYSTPFLPDVKIVLKDIYVAFIDATPEIAISAVIEDRKRNLSIQAEVLAYLIVKSDPQNPEKLTIQPQIREITPVVKWRLFETSVTGLANDIILIRSADAIVNLPPVEIPLSSMFSTNMNASTRDVTIPTDGEGRIVGTLSFPELSANFTISTRHILFYEAGLYIAADLK